MSNLIIAGANRRDIPFDVVFAAVFAIVDGLAGKRLASAERLAQPLQHGAIGLRPLKNSRRLMQDFFPAVSGHRAKSRIDEKDLGTRWIELSRGNQYSLFRLIDRDIEQFHELLRREQLWFCHYRSSLAACPISKSIGNRDENASYRPSQAGLLYPNLENHTHRHSGQAGAAGATRNPAIFKERSMALKTLSCFSRNFGRIPEE